MGITIIPWHVFLEGLKKLPQGTRDEWLQRWCFTEEGAVLVETRELENLSQEASERQIRAALLIRDWMKNRPKTLH